MRATSCQRSVSYLLLHNQAHNSDISTPQRPAIIIGISRRMFQLFFSLGCRDWKLRQKSSSSTSGKCESSDRWNITVDRRKDGKERNLRARTPRATEPSPCRPAEGSSPCHVSLQQLVLHSSTTNRAALRTSVHSVVTAFTGTSWGRRWRRRQP